MNHALCFLVLIFWCISSLSASAQDGGEDSIDFARKLRLKGYADLALEYLETLSRNPPPGKADLVLLEQVRTRLALAQHQDLDSRLATCDQARRDLETLAKKLGAQPDLGFLRLDLAKIHGQALLSQALRLDDPKAQQDMGSRAEKLFAEAAAELVKLAPQIKDEAERRQNRLDLAIIKMDQARTCFDLRQSEIRTKRMTLFVEARKLFETLAREKDADPPGTMACAWLVECCMEQDEPLEARNYLKKVIELPTQDAEPAQRLVRYFELRIIRLDRFPALTKVSFQQKLQMVVEKAEDWLRDYPTQTKTPVGYGVRFELAQALFTQAEEMRDAKDAKLKEARYLEARKIFSTLNENDNDFAEQAIRFNNTIGLRTYNEKTSVDDLYTFDQWFMRAQSEKIGLQKVYEQIAGTEKKEEADKLLESAARKRRDILQALHRALALADAATPALRLEEARLDLLGIYFLMGDPYRTAIVGEAIARVRPLTKRAAQAAAYAINAYGDIFNQDPSESNRTRLRNLIGYILGTECQQVWGQEPVTGIARFQLAMLYHREANELVLEAEQLNKGAKEAKLKAAHAKYREAIKTMREVPELPADSSGYFYAQAKAVFLALEARDKAQTAEDKKAYQNTAREILEIIKAKSGLLAKIDSASANIYFHARMEETKFLYAEAGELLGKKSPIEAQKKYQQMAELINQLEKDMQTTTNLAEDRRKTLSNYTVTMRKYACLGQADLEYRAGNYGKVLELTGNIVDLVKQAKAKTPVVQMKDFQITSDILGLALRANIQNGEIEKAKVIRSLLDSLKGGEDNLLVDNSGVLRNLVGELEELKAQIRDLKKPGDPAKLKLKEKTLANFSLFFDDLAQQLESKAIDKNDLFFLARCYDSLDQHEKAGRLYARYPTPDAVKKDKEKISDVEEKDLQTYWYVQVMQARQLRLARKLPEAKKILDDLLAHKNARQQFLAEKEQNHLLEDNALYGSAIIQWTKFMNNPSLKKNMANDPKLKEAYFDAYYHMTWCYYQHSQTEKVKSAGKEAPFLAKAVDYILRLENASNPEGWQHVGHKFESLLRSEPILNEAYQKQKSSNG